MGSSVGMRIVIRSFQLGHLVYLTSSLCHLSPPRSLCWAVRSWGQVEAASHFCSLSLRPAVPCFLSLACCLFSRCHPPPPLHTLCSLPTMCISLHISVLAFEPGLLRRWSPAAPAACCLFFPSPCSLLVRRAGLWAGSITLCPWYLFSVQKY